MKGRKDLDMGKPWLAALVVITVLVLCVVSVHADYWAGISDNGQYSVTYTENPDGSASLQGAAVGPGGTITDLSNFNNQESCDGGGSTTGVSQNLEISGPQGWAEVIFKDASDGNESHAEMESNGDVFVHQYAGEYTTSGYCKPVETGLTSEQSVWSDNFTSIIASTYSLNADGSNAYVSASATNSDNNDKTLESGYGSIYPDSAVFCVHQESGVVTSLTRQNKGFSYYGYSVPTTTAEQDVLIIGADTASATANSTSSDGSTAMVTAYASNNAFATISGGHGTPLSTFSVDQQSGTGVTTVSGSKSYTFDNVGSLPTYASEDGDGWHWYGWMPVKGGINGYDNAGTSATSSIPQGYMSQVYTSVSDGNLNNVDVGASAGNGRTKANMDFSSSGSCSQVSQGIAGAITTGPGNENAQVITSFNNSYLYHGYPIGKPGSSIDFDLSASTSDNKIEATTCVNRYGYNGTMAASNSHPDSDAWTFKNRLTYYGDAYIRSSGPEDAYVYPHK